jgi:hypothetical protein
MKRRDVQWPTGPIIRNNRKKKVKNLLDKLNKAAHENKDKSKEIKGLQEDIKNLTNLD